jgi:hypothetical protein
MGIPPPVWSTEDYTTWGEPWFHRFRQAFARGSGAFWRHGEVVNGRHMSVVINVVVVQ